MLTFTDAANYLGVSPATLRKIVKRENLTVEQDPLDARHKLLDKVELDRIKAQSLPKNEKVEIIGDVKKE